MRSRRVTGMAVSTLAAVAAGTGGMLAMQAPAHATEKGDDGLIAMYTSSGVVEQYTDGSGFELHSLPNFAMAVNVAWSSDGSRIAWGGNGGGYCGIYTSAPDLTGAVALPTNGVVSTCANSADPQWFDGNKSIIFSSTPAGSGGSDYRLFVQPIAGPGSGAPTLLFSDPGYRDQYPKVVGDLVAYTRTSVSGTDPAQVWVYDKSTGTSRLVMDNAYDADISPDGQKIVFRRPGGSDLFTAGIDGSNVTQITDTGAEHREPVWSPSGTRIAYWTASLGTSVVDVATGVEHTVRAYGTFPAWQPVNPDAPVPPSASPEPPTSAPSSSAPSSQPSTSPSSMPSSTPSSSPSSPPPEPPGVQRVAGVDRFDTGVKISRQIWATASDPSDPNLPADAVVLATGGSFPDALAGGPLAAAVEGPLLLTSPTSLPQETLQEIGRILPKGKTVYILGKTGAVGQGVEDELRALGYSIVRLGGNDRYETSRLIADEYARHVAPPSQGLAPIVLATGRTYADALPAGPLASLIGAPIVLTNGGTLDDATREYIGYRPVLPVGGPAYQAAGLKPIYNGDPCYGLAGADRYATSGIVAECIEELRDESGYGPSAIMGVATGLNYPDALTGGALMGLFGSPLLLTDPNSLTGQDSVILRNASATLIQVELFGGTGALSPLVEQQVIAAVGGVELPPLVVGRSLAPEVARGASAGRTAAAGVRVVPLAGRPVPGARTLAK